MTSPSRTASWVILLFCAGALGQCPGGWQPGFGGTSPDDVVFASVVFDDGSGPHVYASGKFGGLGAGGPVAALWVGTWVQVGANAEVRAFAVWDDGTGSALYGAGDWPVGATHAYGVRRLVGSTWLSVGTTLPALPSALTVFDPDGPGSTASTLHVAGTGIGARKLSGSTWVTIGTGDVRALCVYDGDGAGPGLGVLVAGGLWSTMGAATSWSVASWNGTAWASMGAGVISINGCCPPQSVPGTVTTLGVYDYGSGPILYVGGGFSSPGQNFATWTPCCWSTAGYIPGNVAALGVFDDGGGPKLYVGGSFASAGGVTAANLASFDFSGWSAVGGGVTTSSYAGGPAAYSLTSFDADGPGPGPAVLVATGSFQVAGNVAADCVATWNGSSWAPLGSPTTLSSEVYCVATFDDGTGPALYAGGKFIVAGSVIANRIAKFDGNSWSTLGAGMNGPVYALLVYDDGTGPQLYAGGSFTPTPGQPGGGLARWNGVSWSAVGGSFSGTNPAVCALAVHDDGTGPALFAGGRFTTAGGVAASGVARWNGALWSALGSGVVPPPNGVLANFAPGWVLTLTSFDSDGAGPLPAQLYAGGRFDMVGGVAALNVARWNGAVWSSVGAGIDYPGYFVGGTVGSLIVSSVEGPPKLFACGNFTVSGGTSLSGIARWNGSAWSSVGGGLLPFGFSPTPIGLDLSSWNDGGGEGLYVAGSIGLGSVARWNGAAWSGLGTGLNSWSRCFGFMPPSIGGLVVGGLFTTAGGMPSSYLARWLPSSPAIAIVQPGGPGAGVFVNDGNLHSALEYYNIFSVEPCGVAGSGPYFGLCASDVFSLLNQYLLPVGSVPFHFAATSPGASFGPFALPPGMTVDGISLTVSEGGFCPSSVSRLTVQ